MLNYLGGFSRRLKRIILATYDAAAILLGYSLSNKLVGENFSTHEVAIQLGSTIIFFFLIAFFIGLYRPMVRFLGVRAIKSLVLVTATSVLLSCLVYYFIEGITQIVSSALLFFFSLFLMGGGRLAVREMFFLSRTRGKNRALIYGANDAGIQLLTSLLQGSNYNVFGFVDDQPQVRNSEVHGVRIYPKKALEKIITSKKIDTVILALPNATRAQRKEIIRGLEKFPLRVKSMPRITDLVGGYAQVSDLEEIPVEDLLGRDPVPPDGSLMGHNVTGKVVMVTGAGGSIGSELCRQVSKYAPAAMLLVDSSEFALFKIHQELSDLEGINFELIPILQNIVSKNGMEFVFTQNAVDTVFHAAAYKHVPMVEWNPYEGVINNVIGTMVLVELAEKFNVKSFTLISTDKAVRPTNVMGASKRLAELICQAYAEKKSVRTIFAMVRFGNVLGSSGSVIPRFREQIRAGGPVTVTHPEISRYFMTIPEAVQLVVQASSMAHGGDVFLLDMGKPVRISDLAERLIKLSGHPVKGEGRGNETFGIAIEFSGLRPGEKLYEELLVGESAISTDHPRIKKAHEVRLEPEDLTEALDRVLSACEDRDREALENALVEAQTGYCKPVS